MAQYLVDTHYGDAAAGHGGGRSPGLGRGAPPQRVWELVQTQVHFVGALLPEAPASFAPRAAAALLEQLAATGQPVFKTQAQELPPIKRAIPNHQAGSDASPSA